MTSALSLLESELTKVVYIGLSGKCWHLSGPNAGLEGAWLGVDPKGLMFPPAELLFQEGARQDGATYQRAVLSKREIDFTIHLEGGSPRQFRARHDAWFRDWSRDKQGHLGIFTKYAGWWWLRVRLGGPPEPTGWDKDPALRGYQGYDMVAIADDPLWHSFEEESLWVNTLGTDEGVLRVRNAASQEVWPRYVMPGPGVYFIQDPNDFLRIVQTPPVKVGETLMIDTHPRHPTARLYSPAEGENGRNVWAQLKGRRWLFSVPPRSSTEVVVRVEGGTPSSQVLAVAAPRSERPW